MGSKIMEKLRDKSRKAFLKLKPAARVLTMEALFYEIVSVKAKDEGRSQGEIYRRYLERDKKRRYSGAVPIPYLVLMKLQAGGRKDDMDVIELLKSMRKNEIEASKKLAKANGRDRKLSSLLKESGQS